MRSIDAINHELGAVQREMKRLDNTYETLNNQRRALRKELSDAYAAKHNLANVRWLITSQEYLDWHTAKGNMYCAIACDERLSIETVTDDYAYCYPAGRSGVTIPIPMEFAKAMKKITLQSEDNA